MEIDKSPTPTLFTGHDLTTHHAQEDKTLKGIFVAEIQKIRAHKGVELKLVHVTFAKMLTDLNSRTSSKEFLYSDQLRNIFGPLLKSLQNIYNKCQLHVAPPIDSMKAIFQQKSLHKMLNASKIFAITFGEQSQGMRQVECAKFLLLAYVGLKIYFALANEYIHELRKSQMSQKQCMEQKTEEFEILKKNQLEKQKQKFKRHMNKTINKANALLKIDRGNIKRQNDEFVAQRAVFKIKQAAFAAQQRKFEDDKLAFKTQQQKPDVTVQITNQITQAKKKLIQINTRLTSMITDEKDFGEI